MPKTGARAREMDRLLQSAGLVARAAGQGPRPADLPEGAQADIVRIYRALGGVLHHPNLRPGGWDLAYEGLLVELDEEMHFNRYRSLTLGSGPLASTHWAAAYRAFCDMHERRSGTGGRRWTSPSAEVMFGPAQPHGQFSGVGAPRWKQRALYDSMKDAAASVGVVRLARVSVYDEIAGARVEDVLRGRATLPPRALRDFVESRAVGTSATRSTTQ